MIAFFIGEKSETWMAWISHVVSYAQWTDHSDPWSDFFDSKTCLFQSQDSAAYHVIPLLKWMKSSLPTFLLAGSKLQTDTALTICSYTLLLNCVSHGWLCNPMDCSPPGSSVHEPPGKNIEVGCHFSSSTRFHDPGIKPRSPALQAVSLPSEPWEKPYYQLPDSRPLSRKLETKGTFHARWAQ